MNVQQWNEALAEWFLSESEDRPVYLSATPAELDRMNEHLGLGLADPVADLRSALGAGSFNQARRAHWIWQNAGMTSPPPWLAFLAASALVVEAQTEARSTEFYIALANFLGLPSRLSQLEYEDTLFRWWAALATWLERTENGARGFPTWRGIPERGPRCVIGHPYTQVLLRREDRRDLDAFLSDFGTDNADLPDLADRREAGRHLVGALRRWAGGRYAISPRLRVLLESGGEGAIDTLAYLLLDRLFDRQSENERVAGRRVHIVPVFDELDRELRLAAIAPTWVSQSEPLHLELCTQAMIEPGQPYLLDLQATDGILSSGLEEEFGSGTSLVFQGGDLHPLARRDWDLWCGVRSAAATEDVYLLAATGREQALGLAPIKRVIAGMPSNWSLYGPGPLASVRDSRISGRLIESQRRLIPRLRGGLALDGRRTFLHRGEPIIELPDLCGVARVDAAEVSFQDDELRLGHLDLRAGPHLVEAGPFRFEFTTIEVERPPVVVPTLGRDDSGRVVDATSTDHARPILSGLQQVPNQAPMGTPRLVPVVDQLILFGCPGHVGVVAPIRAPWSAQAGLAHTAIEPGARSTYPHGDRIVKAPWFIAWQSESAWWIAPWEVDGTPDQDPWIDADAWSNALRPIGMDPRVHRFGNDDDPPGETLERWRRYVTTPVDV